MESVTVGGLSIGTGRPKLIVPITAESKAELLQAAQAVRHSPAQLAEWRLDRFEPVTRKESLLDAAQALCAALGDLPVLATYRTVKEGGGGVISETQYAALIETLADSGLVDLIDIELFTGEDFVRREISYCHEKGVKVILSSHDFARTPPKEEMTARLRRMEALGADIAKLAVMPQTGRRQPHRRRGVRFRPHLRGCRPVLRSRPVGSGCPGKGPLSPLSGGERLTRGIFSRKMLDFLKKALAIPTSLC